MGLKQQACITPCPNTRWMIIGLTEKRKSEMMKGLLGVPLGQIVGRSQYLRTYPSRSGTHGYKNGGPTPGK